MNKEANTMYFNIKKYDEEKMSYIKPIHFPKISRNIAVYYREDEKSKKRKIIIKTPKMIMPFAPKEFVNNNRKSYRAKISFSTMTNLYNEQDVKDLFNFVKKVDTVNEETIESYKKKWGLSKDLEYRKSYNRQKDDYPYSMSMCLPHDETYGFLFDVYDESAKKVTIEALNKRCIVSCVLELTDIWFGENEYGANWNLLQVRKFKPYSPIQEFFQTACFIEDQDDPEDKVYERMVELYRKKLQTPINFPIFAPQPQVMYQMQSYAPSASSIGFPPPPPPPPTQAPARPAFVPTKDQLNKALGSLKKTTQNEKSIKVIDGKVIEDKENDSDNESEKSSKKKPEMNKKTVQKESSEKNSDKKDQEKKKSEKKKSEEESETNKKSEKKKSEKQEKTPIKKKASNKVSDYESGSSDSDDSDDDSKKPKKSQFDDIKKTELLKTPKKDLIGLKPKKK